MGPLGALARLGRPISNAPAGYMRYTQRFRLLLSDGFFAAQIPTCFTSEELAAKATALGRDWDALRPHRCQHEAALELFSVARVGHSRRPIAVVNPVAQFYLARAIAKEWPKLQRLAERSKLSLSMPSLGEPGKRAISITPVKQLNEHKVLRSTGSQFVLFSDILQFFPSTYTHAIAWAIEGKAIAKRRRRDMTLLGIRLDELVRFTQSGQTIGIPIGPDTSHMLAELVGAAVDVELSDKLKHWPRGYRHVDDFYLCFDSEREAAEALSRLTEALATYELRINVYKTRIVRVAAFHHDAWVHDFDTFEFAQNRSQQRRDLHRFFDMAFALAERYDDENVMQYALRRIETEIVKLSNWEVLVAYLMRCMGAYPNAIPPCVAIVDTYHRYLTPQVFDAKRWTSLIPAQVAHFAPLERHSEVAWLLWLALRIGTKLDRDAVLALERMRSSVCLVLALALESRGQLRKKLDRKLLPLHTTADTLFEPQWLLTYEGAVQGWLPTAVPAVTNDPYFGALFKRDVHFFDWARAPQPLFAVKSGAGAPAVGDLLDSDDSVYEHFDFADTDEDYLGRRAARHDDEEKDDGPPGGPPAANKNDNFDDLL